MPRSMPAPPDHYATLQVHPRADEDVIKAAYRALMKRHHPDADHATKGGTAARIGAAYEVLSDPDKRRAYDRAAKELGGTVVGNYRVLAKIAEGGFGKTYRGEHVTTGGPVCIKHCSEISSDSEEILIQEANAMWDLRHYSMPAVRDVLRLENGSLALVMSYIPGPTLAQVIEKHGRMDPEHVAWITQRILNALMYMHTHGVVHGDLKPQNVIVQPDSHTVVLVDFGLAMVKPKGDDMAKGYTELFAPPEQLAGRVLIPQSDLFSLGMTMLFAISGDVKHLVGKRVPDDTPPALCDFIRRLIVREPLSRPDVWQKENLCETIEKVRKQAFGRSNSSMKPLKI